MSTYGELDPMEGHRTQFAFKGKKEHIAKVNMPNIAYPNQHTDIEIPLKVNVFYYLPIEDFLFL